MDTHCDGTTGNEEINDIVC